MLVISRKPNEAVMVGDEIRIVVGRVSGKRVTLAIAAPAGMRILRGELEPNDTQQAGPASSAGEAHQPES